MPWARRAESARVRASIGGAGSLTVPVTVPGVRVSAGVRLVGRPAGTALPGTRTVLRSARAVLSGARTVLRGAGTILLRARTVLAAPRAVLLRARAVLARAVRARPVPLLTRLTPVRLTPARAPARLPWPRTPGAARLPWAWLARAKVPGSRVVGPVLAGLGLAGPGIVTRAVMFLSGLARSVARAAGTVGRTVGGTGFVPRARLAA